ncbi:MAG: 1-acyl-sn-glycerol-3-phosphate acyltransferase [Pirellulaceae bacterium]|jgi:1-acyl-sn-glycerol-3-phosphate acyltransferase|nr:1-acyl-sn-glycerol-3-phosphate acyltransferase [Pirellulaceae bacterium]
MPRSLFQRLGYNALRVLARLVGVLVFGLRVAGREHWPTEGGGLVCANHQSFFDPPLVGLTCDRRMNYLARDSLFRVPGLKQLIAFLDAIPIDREGGGLAGLKETLKRLKAGELVLIFPEGTRTHDGEVAPLKPGFIAVARRSKVPLVPVGIDGAYQAWPRTSKFPRLSRLAVVVGPAIKPDEVAAMSDEDLLAELEQRILNCHSTARELRSSNYRKSR